MKLPARPTTSFEAATLNFDAVQAAAVFPGALLAALVENAPAGWLRCDGAVVARAEYPALFAGIGTRHNTGGEAATHFRLPDLQGRAPIGKGTRLEIDTLGKSDGLAVANRSPKHNHGTHQHWTPNVASSYWGFGQTSPIIGDAVNGKGQWTDAAQVGPSGTPVDAPAFLTVNYFIKT